MAEARRRSARQRDWLAPRQRGRPAAAAPPAGHPRGISPRRWSEPFSPQRPSRAPSGWASTGITHCLPRSRHWRHLFAVTLGLAPRAPSSARTIRPVIDMDYRVKPGHDKLGCAHLFSPSVLVLLGAQRSLGGLTLPN